jgi:hypothetical protein
VALGIGEEAQEAKEQYPQGRATEEEQGGAIADGAPCTVTNLGVFAQRLKKVHFSNTPLLWQGTPLHNPLMSQ